MNNTPPQHQPPPERKFSAMGRAATRVVLVLLGFAMLGRGAGNCPGAETVLKEYELKAAFLYNFTKYIEWPTNRFQNANTPFVVAVAGNSACTVELEKIAKERKVNGRTLIIKTVKTPEAARDAHVLFIPAAEDSRLKEWLAAAHGAGVLSSGESEPFARHGGMVNFVPEGGGIRFDINIAQAEPAGLKVSAQLQKLARTLRKKFVD